MLLEEYVFLLHAPGDTARPKGITPVAPHAPRLAGNQLCNDPHAQAFAEASLVVAGWRSDLLVTAADGGGSGGNGGGGALAVVSKSAWGTLCAKAPSVVSAAHRSRHRRTAVCSSQTPTGPQTISGDCLPCGAAVATPVT